MLDYSIGEIESLVLKAYRGAGFSWGVAQEAGAAAGWMAMNQLPVIDQFAQLLPSIDGVQHTELAPSIDEHGLLAGRVDQLCPVVTGVAISDCNYRCIGVQGLALNNVLQPVIMLALLAQSAQTLSVSIGAERYLVAKTQLQKALTPHAHNRLRRGEMFIQHSNESLSDPIVLTQRSAVNELSLQVVAAFAARTYVPATESSRLAGAGAGLLDND